MATASARYLQVHLLSRSKTPVGLSDEHSHDYNCRSQSFRSLHDQHFWWRPNGGYIADFRPVSAKNKHACGRINGTNGLGSMGFCEFKASFSDENLRAFTDRVRLVGWRSRQKALGVLGFCEFKGAFADGTNRLSGRTIGRRKEQQVCRTKVSTSLDFTVGNSGDGASVCKSDVSENTEEQVTETLLDGWRPPKYLWRALAALVIAGQVVMRTCRGRIHWRNSLQQLEQVGPRSVGVCLLTAAFVGMAFTIQFVREFTRLRLNRSVGGVLALAFSRELSPVVTAIIIAGRVGSAFAAELGTMQVSEQTDTLRVLGTDPVDYLVTPRVIACCVALPILTLLCFTVGMAASALLADAVYQVSANIILDSAKRALQPWDLISAMVKSTVFGGLISVISCTWGVTTLGGAKGVGESTTSAVVISLVCIFIADFILSWCFFQGAGDALKAAMG